MISLEMMEELRQDALIEAYQEEQEEIAMRNNDDFFYDAITDKFAGKLDDIRYEMEDYCSHYGRCSDDWFDILVEK